ncbi:MAG: Gfo/Idh/MocA family oxidoreductase [Balneolales bacterium]
MTKRRDFIKQSALGTAGIAIGGMGFSPKSYASIMGANERINLGIIGIRNQGRIHINNWCNIKDSHNVAIKTLCDTDEELFASRTDIVVEKTGSKPLTEWDMHKVLNDKDIDAVSIVTPNHWHALATIWACQAGKHVYVEKPASHNIWEGRKMIEAANKYNRRVQVGLNNRSSVNVREAIQFLHEGGIGEVYMARGLCFKARDSYGIAENSTPPSTFHYDRWLGPAPDRPYNEKRSHYNWHWYWDTGNGDIGNTGPHQIDIARWGLDKHEHPATVYSTGGIYGFRKEESNPEERTPGKMVYGNVETYGHDRTSQETPNTQTCAFMYSDGTMLEFEVRGRYTNHEGSKGQEVGNLFYGTNGWLEIDGSTWRAFRYREKEPFTGSTENNREGNHFANFLDGIRSGKNETLLSDINEGFYSSAIPLLANISYRVGRSLKFNGEDERFINDPEADSHLTRKYRNPYVVPNEV